MPEVRGLRCKITVIKLAGEFALMPHTSGSLRDVQQAQLWSLAGLAGFTGAIANGELRIRWNLPLRQMFGLATTQRLQGGPLFNTLVLVEDRQHIQRACESLIAAQVPMDVTFRARINDSVKQLRVVAERVDHSSRVTGFIQALRSSSQLDQIPPVSQNRWQSVGRLTLLDEATSVMAHELNQPLAAIATFAQAGERLMSIPQPPLDKVRQVFAEVSQQALRAGELIRQMRSLIRRYPPSKTRLSVAELIKGFIPVAEPMAKTHHVDLIISDDLPDDHVFVDVTQINQVLMILLQNALDAVAGDDVQPKSVTVTAHSGQDAVILAVNDSGNGITPNIQSQLFQPFFSTKENGTGLGLASVRNILESYDSHLQYANLPQGGCSFWFALRKAQQA